MTVSAAEQYLIELINRARLDPQAEAARYNLSLNANLPAGTIGTAALGVLAPNAQLEQAAIDHSVWMLNENVFAHEGRDMTRRDGSFGESDPGDRIAEAGYAFTGSWAWRENLAWSGSTGIHRLEDAIAGHHEGLYRSEGHRENTFGDNIREIGVAQIAGTFTQGRDDYNASMLTLNFARSGSDHFVTGVVYDDIDGNAFYGIGEGQSGLTFTVNGQSTSVGTAGGYAVGVAPDATTNVVISDGAVTIATLIVDTSQGNVKVDVVTAPDGSQSLALSGNATLVSGLTDATLLGVGDLSLTGNDDDNALTGNAGNNTIDGAGGDDVLRGGEGRDVSWEGTDAVALGSAHADILIGGAGNDRLHGQSGRDQLSGGAGDDRLTGGSGRDTFIFSADSDRILDFTDNVDMVHLDGSALGLGSATVADVLADASIVDGDAIFDFGGGNVLRINDVDDLDILTNDLLII